MVYTITIRLSECLAVFPVSPIGKDLLFNNAQSAGNKQVLHKEPKTIQSLSHLR